MGARLRANRLATMVKYAIIKEQARKGPPLEEGERDMTKDEIITSIKSFKTRMARAKRLAVEAIEDGNYWAAQTQILDAASYQAIIEEYQFQLECMEVNHDV